EAWLPAPPSFDVTTLVVLSCGPMPTALTLIVNVHTPLGTSWEPVSVIVWLPGSAVNVAPPQPPKKFDGLSTSRPSGSVSVNDTLLMNAGLLFGAEIVNVSVVDWPAISTPVP